MKGVKVVRVIEELPTLDVFRVHTGEKPYPHGEHSEGFTRCSTLLHYTFHSHSGEKAYSCGMCGKNFMSVKPGI